MTAKTITRTNLYSQPSINIFTILDTRTNVADPRDATGARKFVYNTDPMEKAFDFAGEPYIVCKDAEVSAPVRKGADGKKQSLGWLQTITVRTKKDGSSGTRTDAGISDMRQIVDDIIETFNKVSIKGTLRGYDQYDVDVSVLDVDDIVINQDILHETILEVIYSTRIAVST